MVRSRCPARRRRRATAPPTCGSRSMRTRDGLGHAAGCTLLLRHRSPAASVARSDARTRGAALRLGGLPLMATSASSWSASPAFYPLIGATIDIPPCVPSARRTRARPQRRRRLAQAQATQARVVASMDAGGLPAATILLDLALTRYDLRRGPLRVRPAVTAAGAALRVPTAARPTVGRLRSSVTTGSPPSLTRHSAAGSHRDAR
eukprot:COSAG03_NODE_1957_length_3301_cov_12.017489_4_plen_205_part_00